MADGLVGALTALSFLGMVICGCLLDSANFKAPLIGVLFFGVCFVICAAIGGGVGGFSDKE